MLFLKLLGFHNNVHLSLKVNQAALCKGMQTKYLCLYLQSIEWIIFSFQDQCHRWLTVSLCCLFLFLVLSHFLHVLCPGHYRDHAHLSDSAVTTEAWGHSICCCLTGSQNRCTKKIKKKSTMENGTGMCKNASVSPDVNWEWGQRHHLRLCLWLLRSLCRLWEGEGEREDDREELDDGLLWENTLR